MTKPLAILIALTCATSFAQSVIVKGTGAGNVRGTGAGSVRGISVKGSQTITNFPNPGEQSIIDAVGLWAQASSKLSVTNFAVATGPGTIAGLTNLTFTGTGTVSVTADQPGDANWNAAPTVTNAFDVIDRTNYCSGRFTVFYTNLDVVIDNNSGLVWTRDTSVGGSMLWTNAVAYCSNLTNATYSDWRLPSITEFSRDDGVGAVDGLIDDYPSTNSPALPLGHPFTNFHYPYWSSTEVPPFSNTVYIVVAGNDGEVQDTPKHIEGIYVWPVRDP